MELDKSNLAPIILFVYQRLEHTQQVIDQLKLSYLADDSMLIIFSDFANSRKEDEQVFRVRNYIRGITGFKNIVIHEQKKHLGLAKSVISGVTDTLQKHGKAIILEDDLLCSENFLYYMNLLLQKYEANFNVFSVAGYSPPISIPSKYPFDVYCVNRACSWGWATWYDRWKIADWEMKNYKSFLSDDKAVHNYCKGGNDRPHLLDLQMHNKIDSWAIRWDFTHFQQNAVSIYPTISKIQNIGVDGSGVHCKETKKYDVMIDENDIKRFRLPEEIFIEHNIAKRFKRFYDYSFTTLLKRKFKNIISKIIS